MNETPRTPATMIGPDAIAYAGHAAGVGRVPSCAAPDPASHPAVPHRSPYAIIPPARPRRGIARLAGCVFTLLVMAALCFGVIYLMWRFTGR